MIREGGPIVKLDLDDDYYCDTEDDDGDEDSWDCDGGYDDDGYDDGEDEGGGSGGGGGGGDSGGDDDDEEEDAPCPDTCTQEQCDLAEEYDDAVSWPCSKFHSVDSRYYVGENGTHGGIHNGYGYIHPKLSSGFPAVEAYFPEYYAPGSGGFTITSVWRCPVGNERAGGVSDSQHKRGTAIDFTGYFEGQPWSLAVRGKNRPTSRFRSWGFIDCYRYSPDHLRASWL